jgi:hypothetical protein
MTSADPSGNLQREMLGDLNSCGLLQAETNVPKNHYVPTSYPAGHGIVQALTESRDNSGIHSIATLFQRLYTLICTSTMI